MTSRLFSFACAGFLLAALLLGGATRSEVFTQDIVGLLGLPLLGWAVWRLRSSPVEGQELLPFFILAACFAIGLIQLIPLPPDLWTALPGRAPIVRDLAAAGVNPGWAPISLSPTDTVAALLALVPATALFLASRTLDQRGRRWLVRVLLAAAVASAVIGGLQVLGGSQSPLRFYAVTNPEPAVGFFANRNHLAALFVCVIPLAAYEALEAAARRPVGRLRIAIMLALMLLAAAGVAMTQSRAGVLLLGVAVLGALAMAWRAGAGHRHARLLLGGIGLVLALGALAAPIVFSQTFDRFDGGMSGDIRLKAAQVAAGAAWEHAPFGSGLGTFVPVYMMHETPDSMQTTYVNHAHDDWLELLVEAGLLALAAMAVFLFWFARQALRAWGRRQPGGGPIVQAASLVIGLLLLHSLVDYPLRTAAMMCVFALACGFMLKPRAAEAPPADTAV